MHDEIEWKLREFEELSNDELYDMLHLRMEVFVVEQRCFYQDLDYDDQKAIHLLGYIDGKLMACSRIFAQGTKYDDGASFGRVIVAKEHRGNQLGRSLVEATLNVINAMYGEVSVVISAQSYLDKFYGSFGFEQTGEEYMDAEMPHIPMKKS